MLKGQTFELFRAEGPGCVRHFWLVPSTPETNPILRIYADDWDHPQVDMRMHHFFGVLLGEKPYRVSFDNWLTVWLDGKRLTTLRHDAGLKVAVIPVQSKKGDNDLLIKLSNFPNTNHRLWAWSCVVDDEDENTSSMVPEEDRRGNATVIELAVDGKTIAYPSCPQGPGSPGA